MGESFKRIVDGIERGSRVIANNLEEGLMPNYTN
jgi:hypothetical protein